MKTKDYFKDILSYPEIQEPGPLALLAEAEGAELDALYDAGEKVREQFFPSLAEIESLAIHGLGRGITRHTNETDGLYRKRVVNAFAWQKLAGHYHGLNEIFAAYGFPVIKNNTLTGDKWAEFELNIDTPDALDEATWDLLIRIANEYKEGIARLSTIRTRKKSRGILIIRTKLSTREEWRVFPPECVLPKPQGTLRVAAAAVSYERWRVGKG